MENALKKKVLVLDGAMGTMLQGYGLTEDDFRGEHFKHLAPRQKGNNELLVLTRPDVIADVHRRYLNAGADIIETNTFNAQRISLADYGCEHLVEAINVAAVRLARACADEFSTPEKPRFVVASVGPTNKSLSISADVADPAARSLTFDELVAAYEEQMTALVREGVDALLIETIFDTLNAKAALYAAQSVMAKLQKDVPFMLSVTLADKAGRMLSGQTLEAFLASVAHADVLSVGLNCSFGAKDMQPFIEHLSKIAPCYVSAYPNAGLPNGLGDYDQTPAEMAECVRPFIEKGLVNIIGGCCGTTDKYIAEYQKLLSVEHPLRSFSGFEKTEKKGLTLSGLDALRVDSSGFLTIGERCNVAGSKKFLRLIKEKNYEEAVSIARCQVETGAQVLDVNMDDGLLDAKAEMSHFLRLLMSEPGISRVPIMIDSSRWEVILEGLKCVQGKCVVNSISLEDGETSFLEKAREIRRYGAAVVVMAFDENGQASTFERRIEICERAYRLLTEKAGMPASDIIFDPNILAVCTGMSEHDNYAVDFIRAAAWIREHLPGAHVSGGVSNLSFAFRGNNALREMMHSVFLHLACEKGLNMAIVNPSTKVSYESIDESVRRLIESALLNEEGAVKRLIEAAPSIGTNAVPVVAKTSLEWREKSLDERLRYALEHGDVDFIETDLGEALEKYPKAVDIIEDPLMRGMNVVGERFAKGEMFLPQLVKTARTMQKAVDFLRPHIGQSSVGGNAGKILLATVKGDVHDIGKNIVSVVLACNGFEIVDLGVMCEAERIVETARECRPDIIGLCGLITPSLDEMRCTLQALREAGITTPVAIGGATTSNTHTALRLAPVYDGAVVWVKDASQMALASLQIINARTREAFLQSVATEQEGIRSKQAVQKQPELLSLEEARKRKPHFD